MFGCQAGAIGFNIKLQVIKKLIDNGRIENFDTMVCGRTNLNCYVINFDPYLYIKIFFPKLYDYFLYTVNEGRWESNINV